jgi:hypothetical protein
MITYHASKLHNPDSYGMDFNSYVWRGVVVENGQARLERLTDSAAMAAYLQAKDNNIYECTTAGMIAAPVGYAIHKRKKRVRRGDS